MFITATKEFNTFQNFIPAPYIRKSFTSDKSRIGKIEITACGFYELFFNGKRITKGVLAPYISNTDHIVYVDKYEVEIQKGENAIGIILGNGLQNNPGGWVWGFDKYDYRGAPKVAVTLTFGDVVIKSDQSFKTYPSPIRFDDYRYGEIYDANCEIEGWNLPGFDDSAWNNTLIAEAPKGEMRFCEAEPIIKDFEMQAVDIFPEDDGFVYDFGVNHTGICRLSVDGKKGQTIELVHSEIMLDGKFNIEKLFCDVNRIEPDIHFAHKDVYICKDGKQTYTPTFTYHGFRYVKVTGITAEQATKDLLTYVVIHSDIKENGGFWCSDDTVNKLQEITLRSDISNFHYFPTDCPHREKNGWTADAALSCEQMMLNFAPQNSYREWQRNICKAQNEKGALPGIVPAGIGFGFEWGNGPAWDCVLVWLPYYIYMYTGKTEMIYESADTILKYLKYIESRNDEKGLIHIGLGDWCHTGRDEGDPKAPLEVTDTATSLLIARRAAFLFDVIGKKDDGEYAEKLENGYKKAFREHLIDFDTMKVYGDCQTSQALALYYGIFEENEKPKAFDYLLKLIQKENDHFDCGVIGGRIIFHLLADNGYADLAYKMITRPDFPSYAWWLSKGATTLWEAFYEDKVKSCNHHFWGDVSAWFIKCLAGLNYNPNANDIKYLEIKPNFVSGLDFAKAWYNCPFGKIEVSWKREDGKIVLKTQIPKEITARLILPKGFNAENKIITSGEYTVY